MSQSAINLADPNPDHATGAIDLVVPAHPEFFLLARMNASGVASMLDFGLDEIEDLKLAVNELCTLCLLGATPESRMALAYRWDPDSIDITCATTSLASIDEAGDEHRANVEHTELAELILGALVDELERSAFANGGRTARMVLRRRQADDLA